MRLKENLDEIIDRDVVDSQGEKVGKVADIYLDEATNEPEWLAVHTGLFGMKTNFIPLEGASVTGDAVTVPYPKDQVKDAPKIDPDGELSQQEEADLYTYYGMSYSQSESSTGLAGGGVGQQTRSTDGYDTSGPTTDKAMTRSEEELRVGKQQYESGRVRLRKYLVTEQQSVTVPVTREEVRIEREPITDGNVDAAMSGPELSEEEHEVVLHEERPVVDKTVVPKERVRLAKDEVVDDQSVSADLRKERIDVEGDTDAKKR